MNIRGGLEGVRRTQADVAKDKAQAFLIRRFHQPAIWRATPGGIPVDLSHEPGDFCVSSSEWPFDGEWQCPAAFDMLIIPQGALSPLLAGGRLRRPFRLPGLGEDFTPAVRDAWTVCYDELAGEMKAAAGL